MKLVFVDIDTQRDFMDEDGALYVPGAEDIKNNLRILTDYAIEHDIDILKTHDYHSDECAEFIDNGGPFPPHCVKNSSGVDSISETDEYSSDIYLFEKNSYDVFDEKDGNNKFSEFLCENLVTKAVVYGVATDYCVKAAVLGLRRHGVDVLVVAEAIKGVAKDTTDEALTEMREKGAKIRPMRDIFAELRKESE